MELKLQRETESNEWTQGRLFINGELECYTLEDQKQKGEKVMHETRIPAGKYEIKLRTFGGHHERYKVKFETLHAGMLWLQDVPGFTDILIHIGNTDDDTSGCILVGRSYGHGKIWNSTAAYEAMYRKVVQAFDRGEQVYITIKDI